MLILSKQLTDRDRHQHGHLSSPCSAGHRQAAGCRRPLATWRLERRQDGVERDGVDAAGTVILGLQRDQRPRKGGVFFRAGRAIEGDTIGAPPAASRCPVPEQFATAAESRSPSAAVRRGWPADPIGRRGVPVALLGKARLRHRACSSLSCHRLSSGPSRNTGTRPRSTCACATATNESSGQHFPVSFMPAPGDEADMDRGQPAKAQPRGRATRAGSGIGIRHGRIGCPAAAAA